jgi:pimeloyl-ACP methyl ester carboxylesterase
MGGFVASFLGSDDARVKSLVLWAGGARASTMFPNYIRMDKRRLEKWIRDGKVDLAGNVLGSKFLIDLKKLGDSFPLLKNFKGKALILHGDKDRSVPVVEASVYKKVLGSRATLRILKGSDHTFNRSDWEKTLLATTAQWLKKNL